MIQKMLIGILLLSFFFLAGMKYPPNGTDSNSYRCIGGLVSIGDRMSDLIETCGEPIREDQQDIQPGRILIYRFDQSRVYYFEFLNDRLSRIYDVSCLQDNPDCE